MRVCGLLSVAILVSACSSAPPLVQAGNTLAPTGDAAQAGPVDGIECAPTEQLVFHLHSHLAVYEGDDPKLLPAGIGIGPPLEVENNFVAGGSCFSWLHTHDQTGLIHIESPEARVFTLGDFFDVWGQPLSSTAVGPATGKVSVFVDGEPFTDDPRDVPLVTMDAAGNYAGHEVLQLDIGPTVHPAEAYQFPAGY